ncbi:hypothetical protein [Prochlorococcus sp. MIT 1201]|uniref:hypothetical protein n=1 Tax=Prochlorococcus sp. MIT 1201 TaxID=3082535 RepID=UPI0039A50899
MSNPKEPKDEKLSPKDEEKVELSDEDLEGVDGGVGGDGGVINLPPNVIGPPHRHDLTMD